MSSGRMKKGNHKGCPYDVCVETIGGCRWTPPDERPLIISGAFLSNPGSPCLDRYGFSLFR